MSSPVATFYKCAAYVDNRVLAAGVAETITKPSGYSVAVITVNADCWIRRGGTAAAPAADVTDGTGSILLPAGSVRIIDFNDASLKDAPSRLASISIISAGAALVSTEWFA